MKKIILGLILVIVLAIAAGVYYVLTNLDAIVKAAIEKHGSAATQTAVRVDKVKIRLTDGATSGVGTINGLTIANPTGFATGYAFSLGEIRTQIDIESLKEEPYIIDEITVRAPQVFMEINKDRKTNLNELKKKLSTGEGASQAKPTSGQPIDPGPRLKIRRLLFTDGNILAKIVPLKNKEYDLKLPTLTMTNLGGQNGATGAELTKEIIDRLIEQAKSELKKSQYGQELEKLKGKAKARLAEEKAKVADKIADEKAEAKQKADSKLDEEKQKAADKLKGFLNK